jgi:hypothetical protein
MIVAECNRHGIGDVIGFKDSRQFQFRLDSPLDLLFSRIATPGQQPLHLPGSIMDNLGGMTGRDKQDHSPGVGHQKRALRELTCRKDLLESQDFRPILFADLRQALADFLEPFRQSSLCIRADDPGFEQPRGRRATPQNRIPGPVESWVNTKNHLRRVRQAVWARRRSPAAMSIGQIMCHGARSPRRAGLPRRLSVI